MLGEAGGHDVGDDAGHCGWTEEVFEALESALMKEAVEIAEEVVRVLQGGLSVAMTASRREFHAW